MKKERTLQEVIDWEERIFKQLNESYARGDKFPPIIIGSRFKMACEALEDTLYDMGIGSTFIVMPKTRKSIYHDIAKGKFFYLSDTGRKCYLKDDAQVCYFKDYYTTELDGYGYDTPQKHPHFFGKRWLKERFNINK